MSKEEDANFNISHMVEKHGLSYCPLCGEQIFVDYCDHCGWQEGDLE